MTEWLDVSDITPRIGYTATASQTAFTVPFVFFENSDLNVYQNGTLLALDVDYAVTGAEDDDGGTVTLGTGAAVGDAIMISRHVPIEQTTHIPPSGPLDVPAINIQFSKLIAIDQQLAETFERSLRQPDSEATVDMELPGDRANKILGFDTGGAPVAVLGPSFVSDEFVGAALVESKAVAQVTHFDLTTEYLFVGGDAAAGDETPASYVRGAGDGGFNDGSGNPWKPGPPFATNQIDRPAYGPVASPWPYFLGDSLFTNLHVTTSLPNLIKASMGWSSISAFAVSGATIADQASIYGFQRAPSVPNPSFVWLGTNDVLHDGSDNRTSELTSLEGLRALICHLAIPTSKRVTGQAMTTASGSWSNMGTSLDPGGTTIATNGAVKRATVTGRHVVVAGWASLSANGTAIVGIGNDANSLALTSDTLTFKRPVILTNSPGGIATETVPFVRIYKNVGVDDDSKMTVSVAVSSATGAGNDVYIGYVAGLTGKQDEVMPLVHCFNLHDFTPTAETAQSTSAARRARFNAGINNIVDEMLGLGLWVVPVDAKSVLWNTALYLGADGLHQNDAGNTALTSEAVAAVAASQGYYHKRNSQLSNLAMSDTVGSDLQVDGRFVTKDFHRSIVPRAAVGSGFSVHCNGSSQGPVGTGSQFAVSWTTEVYDVGGDFASSAWTPPAGQVQISACVTFTVSTDQASYEMLLYKNGVSYKRIGKVAASGNTDIAVFGSCADMAAAGDSYSLVVTQNSGSNATIDGSPIKTWFSGYSAN